MKLQFDNPTQRRELLYGYAPWRHHRLPDDLPEFSELFSDPTLDLEVEAGCGMGTFLEERLKMRSDINYLGFETGRGRSRLCKRLAEKNSTGNAQVLNIDARIVTERYIPADSVSMFHVYFPDPWPKQKHWRRRLLDKDFLSAVYRCLKKEGRLEIATDHEGYFKFIGKNNQMAALNWSQIKTSVNDKIFCPHIRTDFERMWMNEKRTLFYMEMVK